MSKPAAASERPRLWLVSALALILSVFVTGLVIDRALQAQINERRAQASILANSHASALENHLLHSMSAAYTLATYVRNTNNINDHFDAIARDMLGFYPGVAMLSLSPNGIITMIMPRDGNEGALGFNQLADMEQRGESLLARRHGQLSIAGPLSLAQGGSGIVGRHPINIPDSQGRLRFWGFANVTLRLPEGLEAAHLNELIEQGFVYELWRLQPETGERQVIASHRHHSLENPVEQWVNLPNARWTLSVEPANHWFSPIWLGGAVALGILFCGLFTYVAYLISELRWRKANLEVQIHERARDAHATQEHLNSVINAIPDLMFELDLEGRYLNFFSHDPEQLGFSFEQIRGKTVAEVLAPDAATAVLDTLSEAARNGWSFGNQFCKMLHDGLRYYELSAARKVNPDPDGRPSFIVISRNITQRKRAELEARASLERFQSLVSASNTGAWEYFHQQGFVRCSPEYFSMLGRDIKDYDMSGKPNLHEAWSDLMHPDDVQEAQQRFRDYLAQNGGQMYESKFRLRHKEGHWVWIMSRGRTLRNESGSNTGITLGTHIDISEQVANETKLALAARVFERGSEGFVITDAQQRILMVNRAFTLITGYSDAEVIGQHSRILSSGRHDAEFYQAMWEQINSAGLWQGEVWNRRKDGSIYPEWLSISRLTDESGEVLNYIGIISDISRLKKDQEQIYRLAYYDPLTRLPNRMLLEERATYALQVARRTRQPLALLFLDLDNFKNINDSLGHQAGDCLLMSFAQRLNTAVREEDTFARPGGDEFVLMLPDTEANGAAHTAQKLLDMLIPPFHIEGHELSVSSSIGIALFPNDGDDLHKLYTNADIAMYRAKHEGRNTYSFFTPELQTHYVRTLQLENALRRALELNQLDVHYQPQQEISSGSVVGLEALLRWKHPELGQIPPSEFIPIAETSGLILSIGEWVLRTACQQLRTWIDAGIAPPKIAINLSAVQFRQRHLPELILDILTESELPPEYLELELTEGLTMNDPERAVEVINQLHAAGVSLSIDDFGTGYSSLSYLKRFKIYKLKIDQSFVRDLTVDAEDKAIVSTIITLAQSLGLRTVAEGVEFQDQLTFLQSIGCHDIQGYLLSKPLSADATETFLRTRDSLLP